MDKPSENLLEIQNISRNSEKMDYLIFQNTQKNIYISKLKKKVQNFHKNSIDELKKKIEEKFEILRKV